MKNKKTKKKKTKALYTHIQSNLLCIKIRGHKKMETKNEYLTFEEYNAKIKSTSWKIFSEITARGLIK